MALTPDEQKLGFSISVGFQTLLSDLIDGVAIGDAAKNSWDTANRVLGAMEDAERQGSSPKLRGIGEVLKVYDEKVNGKPPSPTF